MYFGLSKNKALPFAGRELASVTAEELVLAGDEDSPPTPVHSTRYALRSLPQSQLLLHSPLCTPRRPRRIKLVSETSHRASSAMTGSGAILASDSDKLDQILAQLTTMNNRLDSHDRRITRTEKFQQGDHDDKKARDDGLRTPKRPSSWHPGGGDGGGSSGDDSDVGGGFRRDRRGRRDDDWRRPRHPKLNFPHFDGKSNPLPWINKCEHFFQG